MTDSKYVVQYCCKIERLFRIKSDDILACEYAITPGDAIVTRVVSKKQLENIVFNTYCDDKAESLRLGGGMHVWAVNDISTFRGPNLSEQMKLEFSIQKGNRNALVGAHPPENGYPIYHGVPSIPPKEINAAYKKLTTPDLLAFIEKHSIPFYAEPIPTDENSGYFNQKIDVSRPVWGRDKAYRMGLYVPVIVSYPDKADDETFFTIFQRYVNRDDSYLAAENTPTQSQYSQSLTEDLAIIDTLISTGTFAKKDSIWRLVS